MCCVGTTEGMDALMTTVCQRDFSTEDFYAPLGAILQVEWHGRLRIKADVSVFPLTPKVQLDSGHSICQ